MADHDFAELPNAVPAHYAMCSGPQEVSAFTLGLFFVIDHDKPRRFDELMVNLSLEPLIGADSEHKAWSCHPLPMDNRLMRVGDGENDVNVLRRLFWRLSW